MCVCWCVRERVRVGVCVCVSDFSEKHSRPLNHGEVADLLKS